MPIFTIFTGTYNSEKVIQRVFHSILEQSFKDFEWIIIDDSSKDNTCIILEEFKLLHQHLNIVLIKHSINSGIAKSRYEALTIARGKYFITWDHDDEQDINQLSTFYTIWSKHDSERVSNIFAKIQDQNGKLLGKKFREEPCVSDYIALHNKYLLGNLESGNVIEHHVCTKTSKYLEVVDIFIKNPQMLDGLLPNGSDVWGMMAYLGYKTIFTNSIVRKYFIAERGRISMSTINRNTNAKRIFQNKLLWVNYFNRKMSSKETLWKFRSIFALLMYGFLNQYSFSNILSKFNYKTDKLFGILFCLPAYYLSRKYSKR